MDDIVDLVSRSDDDLRALVAELEAEHTVDLLVARREQRDVFEAVAAAFSGVRAFQIHDPVDARVDRRNVVRPARLDENRSPGIAERGHERQDIPLKERLAARDLDQRAVERQNLREDLVKRSLFPFEERILRVAIRAPQVATGQPDKYTREPGPRALALDRLVDFVDF